MSVRLDGVPGVHAKFRRGVHVVNETRSGELLRWSWGEIYVRKLAPDMRELVPLLWGDSPRRAKRLGDDEGNDQQHPLERFARMGVLTYVITSQRSQVADATPMTPGRSPAFPIVRATAVLQLSRFAYLRREAGGLVLESPLSTMRVRIFEPGIRLLWMLAAGIRCRDLYRSNADVTVAACRAIVRLLVGARFIEAEPETSCGRQESLQALEQWEFHDLLFHNRSRPGRHDYPVGATYPFAQKVPPPPALKNQASDGALGLYAPDLEELMIRDVPFTQVLENRQSLRQHGTRAITASQLGEFLFRTARVRSVQAADATNDRAYEATSRPYPNGGSCYELDIYVVVVSCQGISEGVYLYDPLHHELLPRQVHSTSRRSMAEAARRAGGLEDAPQLLLVVTARINRISWKYQGLSYSLVLKNVGVLYQTMYLVAAAMNLAACALGTGDSWYFARAVALDYYAECRVGEFVLGSAPGAK